MAVPADLPPLIGQSPAFLEVSETISRLAPLDRPVLVIGERGTGKELVAARIHYLSRRWEAPFAKLNCAALVESLLESELFGHEAGAFTGAARRRLGRFEIADGGTLFLDEIAHASLSVQEKILRAVEYGEFERVGGNATLHVDVRVVGATNVDLPAAADAGRFRHDLLDRLSFAVVTVPPLRARAEDIPLLAHHFARAMAHDLGRTVFPGFTREAMRALRRYGWPGNVRELKNVVERAVFDAEPEARVAEIEFDPFASPHRPAPFDSRASRAVQDAGDSGDSRAAQDAGEDGRTEQGEGRPGEGLDIAAERPFPFRDTVAAFEKDLLQRALAANRHNQRATAAHLGLTYSQLRNDLRRHGLLGARGGAPDAPA